MRTLVTRQSCALSNNCELARSLCCLISYLANKTCSLNALGCLYDEQINGSDCGYYQSKQNICLEAAFVVVSKLTASMYVNTALHETSRKISDMISS